MKRYGINNLSNDAPSRDDRGNYAIINNQNNQLFLRQHNPSHPLTNIKFEKITRIISSFEFHEML